MYTEGLQIGNNSYLLQDEDNLVLAISKGTTEQMEEYLQVANDYDEGINRRNEQQQQLSKIRYLDKLSKKFEIAGIGLSIFFIVTGIIISTVEILLIMPAASISITSMYKLKICSTKKERKQKKASITKKIEEIQKELEELKIKRDILKEKIEYSETELQEDGIIPITTVDNKKANVKIRVLRLEQSR